MKYLNNYYTSDEIDNMTGNEFYEIVERMYKEFTHEYRKYSGSEYHDGIVDYIEDNLMKQGYVDVEDLYFMIAESEMVDADNYYFNNY